MEPAYKSTEEGFWLTFPNGYTVSVQFSEYTYSDNGETSAEVAVMGDNGDFVKIPDFTPDHDQVTPRVTVSELTALLERVMLAAPGTFATARVGS